MRANLVDQPADLGRKDETPEPFTPRDAPKFSDLQFGRSAGRWCRGRRAMGRPLTRPTTAGLSRIHCALLPAPLCQMGAHRGIRLL
jgi:hypothetical protein